MASTFLLAAVFVLLPFSPERGSSQVRFRTYEDDRPRLERYLDEAKDASTREEFERIMDSGKEALAAAWEREADAAITRALKEARGEEGLEAELSRERAAAFEEWERGMSAEVARAEGAFFAARQDLSYADFDRGELRTLLEEAKGAAELGAWDELVDGGSAALSSAWERAFEEKMIVRAWRGRRSRVRRGEYGARSRGWSGMSAGVSTWNGEPWCTARETLT
jgi:hypothetical protein